LKFHTLIFMDELIDVEELQRLEVMMSFEKKAYKKGFKRVGGIDEAGRGPLAGPVVAAVCILPKKLRIPLIDDSKKLSPKVRQQLFQRLLNDPKVSYGIGIIEHDEIDKVNIYQATILAMFKALENLSALPDCILVDGMQLTHPVCECIKIIKGDQLSQSIAAASIIAKETRDALMIQYHEQWPQYGFNQHRGYATAQHLQAIQDHGPCPIHRRSFDPIKSLLNPNLELALF
jgi:ribonuclease HII